MSDDGRLCRYQSQPAGAVDLPIPGIDVDPWQFHQQPVAQAPCRPRRSIFERRMGTVSTPIASVNMHQVAVTAALWIAIALRSSPFGNVIAQADWHARAVTARPAAGSLDALHF